MSTSQNLLAAAQVLCKEEGAVGATVVVTAVTKAVVIAVAVMGAVAGEAVRATAAAG